MNIHVLTGVSLAGPSGVWQHVVLWPGGRGRLYVGALTASGTSAKISVTASNDAGSDVLSDLTAPGSFDFELPPGSITFDANITGSDSLSASAINIASLNPGGT